MIVDSEPVVGSGPAEDRSVIGRAGELSMLESALSSADGGKGSLFLLTGEPGIGKTTLASEFADRAREAGARVLWGRSWEGTGAPAYWPWVQAIRPLLRSTDPSTLEEWLGAGAADVAQMSPEIYGLFPELPALPERDAEAARFRLFDSTTALLANAAASQPIVLVLDDLHSADQTSLLLLRFAAIQVAEIRMVVIGTFRHAELMGDNPLAEIAVDIVREPTTREIRLTGLGEGEVAEFLERATRVRPDPRLVTRLHHDTTGNPLYLEQAIRFHATEGGLFGWNEALSQHLPVPSRITDLIGRRVDRVGERCQHALRLGSVLGPEFSFEALRRLGAFTADELLTILDEAVVANLLLRTRDSPATFAFPHDLVRESLYEGISQFDRTRLHARAASTLEELHGQDLEDHLAELAYHYYEAAPGGHSDLALSYARRAGKQAVKSLAYEEAMRLNEMALSAYELGGESDESLRVEILLDLGDAQTRAAEDQLAKATFLKAAGLAKRLGDTRLLARAAFGYGGIFVWQRAGADREMVPLLQEALMILGGADDHLRVRLLARLAGAMRDQPDRETCDALSAEAVKLARTLDDPATLCYALEGRIAAVMWPENPEYRLDLARELVDIAERHGLLERAVGGHQFEVIALLDLGLISEAKAKIDELTRGALRLGQPNQVFVAPMVQTIVDLIEGNYTRAEATVLRSLEARFKNRDEFSSIRLHLFLLRREQGRLDELESFVRDSVAEFPWYPLHRSSLACLLTELGRTEEARQVFDELAAGEFALLHRDNEWLLGMCMAAEACCRLSDRDAARIMYDQLLPFSGRHAMGWGEGSVGAVDRYLGLLAATMGAGDAAASHFEEAIAINVAMGARPWAAHSQLDYARFLMGLGDGHRRRLVQDLLDEASVTARELGMPALTREIEALGHERPASRRHIQHAKFARRGEFWEIVYLNESLRLKDTKGMHYIARLLGSPGQEIHVLDLVTATGDGSRSVRGVSDMPSSGFETGDVVIDKKARRAYQQRLEELSEELDEAEKWNDPERASSARSEIEFLTETLRGASGLAGRTRKTPSASERARVNVTRAIRSAIARLGANGKSIGGHLDATIKTGTYCSYSPDPLAPIQWDL